MKSDLVKQLTVNFESAAYTADDVEFWYARDLQKLLGYSEWRNFLMVIEKARIACQNAKSDPADHFVDVNNMIVAKNRQLGIGPICPGQQFGWLKIETASG